jgi:signal transduction histidine kinase
VTVGHTGRWHRLLAAVALGAALGSAAGAPLVLTQAQLLRSAASEPPDDTAPWQAVMLPDQERRPEAGQPDDAAWYRMVVELPTRTAADAPWAVYLPYFHDGALLFLNGQPFGRIRGSDDEVKVRWVRPFLLPVPDTLLYPGRNVLHVRALLPESRSLRFPAPGIGTQDDLLPAYDARVFWQRTLPQFTVVLAGLVAAFVASIWWRRRDESLYGWLALAMLLWGLRTLAQVVEVVPADLWAAWRAVFFAASAGFVVALLLFTLRFAALRVRGLGTALWVYVAIGPLAMLLGGAAVERTIDHVWAAGMVAIGLAIVGLAAWSAWRQRTWQAGTLLGAFGLALAAGLHDYLIVTDHAWIARLAPLWLGQRIYLLHLAANALLLVMTAILTARFVQSLKLVEELNQTLEHRVADRERQLAGQFEAMARLERDRAVEGERQRIMLDMHDGLGSQLLTSLARVERGAMAQRDVADTLRECIAEMRLALDALAPSDDDDFRAAFGNFRYRWDTLLADAGVQANWSVAAPDDGLPVPAHQRLELLRVLQEALTNVVKHARARHVRIRVEAGAGGLRVEVHDDGQGFEVAAAGRVGHGLRSMRARAQRLGAALTIEAASPGTRVTLRVDPPAPGAPLPAVAHP